MRKTAAEERLKWFKAFLPLYEKAAPTVMYIADPDRLKSGELPVSLDTIMASSLTLRPVLGAVRRLRKPREKQLADIQKGFEVALTSCIKAAEASASYLRAQERGLDRWSLLTTIISSIVLAQEYMDSVSKVFEPLLGITPEEQDSGLN
jgi:hypothetical protein